jgi:negative regulator of sigma-B (phosphoserine phosphatase)
VTRGRATGPPAPRLDWGVASSPHPGEQQSGDACLVRPVGAAVLVAVVDALGHGDEAAEVSRTAVAALGERAGEPLVDIVRGCHRALRGSRGVTLALASFHAGGMTWLAVGNVEALLVRRGGGRRFVVQRPGIVGDRLPPLRAATEDVRAGDVLVLATDGIRPAFATAAGAGGRCEPPETAAGRLHRGFASGSDDALVLVARVTAEST